jgi:hypothetical protein
MLYAAKCYWPGVTRTDLEQVAERAGSGAGTRSGSVSYLGSLLFAADDLVLYLFQGLTGPRSSRPASGLASPPNGSWIRPGSARTRPPGKERRNDQADRRAGRASHNAIRGRFEDRAGEKGKPDETT